MTGGDGGPRLALHLGLDAEDELARGSADTSAATHAAIERAAATLTARALVPASIVPWLPSGAAPREVVGALCWCPTPAALRAVEAAGFVLRTDLGSARGETRGAAGAPVAVPGAEVLARANDRATFAEVSPLPRGAVARTQEEAERHLAAQVAGSRWLLKRALSAAGRGARRVTGGVALPAGDAAWLAASLRRGAVTLDPFVPLVAEYALHGWLDGESTAVLGEACVQDVDPHGVWRGTARLVGAELELRARLARAAHGVADTLRGLGYRGPFGIDAYTWRDLDGTVRLRAPSEVNARFTMGWWTGMGAAG